MNKILFQFLFLLISSFILFSSCSSEDEEIYPKILIKDGISSISDIRLFTDGKEIVDMTVIADFIKDKGFNPFDNSVIEDVGVGVDILFLSKESVSFDEGTNLFSVKKNKTRFLFTSSSPIYYKFNGIHRGDSLQISRQMLKYVDKLMYVSPLSGYDGISHQVIVGYGSYNNIEISYFVYEISENSLYSSSFYKQRGIMQNEFDPKVLSLLGARDTLAIQEFKCRFKSE